MRYILVNQFTGHLFKDVVFDFGRRGLDTEILTGWIEPGGKALPDNVKPWYGIEYNRKNTLTKLITWSIFTLQLWLRLRRYDAKDTKVLYVSNPPFGPLLAPLFKMPYAILIYDLYPDILIHTGTLGTKSPVVRWWSRRNRKVFDRAEIVFTLSNSMRDAILPYFSDPKTGLGKIKVIANWADNQHIVPVPKSENPFLTTNGMEGKFIVLYSGNMGSTHPLEVLITVAEALKQHSEILFLFIGEGVKKTILEQLVKEKNLQNVAFLPLQPFDQIHFSLSAADLNVIALEENAASSSVPSKTYSALAAGSALLGITGQDSEVATLIEETKAGRSFRPTETEAIAEFILRMRAEPALCARYKNNALKASELFTPANAALYFETWSSLL
jgi:glycosyltransferase involved in cell wall biosynthesis